MALPDLDPTTLSGNYIVVALEGEIAQPSQGVEGELKSIAFAALVKGKVESFSQIIKPQLSCDSKGNFETSEKLDFAKVDELATEWLLPRGGMLGEGKIIPVGFNVGAQGIPAFLDSLPRTKALFSDRVIDLNTICLTLEGVSNTGKGELKFKGWKSLALKETKKVLLALKVKRGKDPLAFEAAQALLSWIWFRGIMDNNLEFNFQKKTPVKEGNNE